MSVRGGTPRPVVRWPHQPRAVHTSRAPGHQYEDSRSHATSQSLEAPSQQSPRWAPVQPGQLAMSCSLTCSNLFTFTCRAVHHEPSLTADYSVLQGCHSDRTCGRALAACRADDTLLRLNWHAPHDSTLIHFRLPQIIQTRMPRAASDTAHTHAYLYRTAVPLQPPLGSLLEATLLQPPLQLSHRPPLAWTIFGPAASCDTRIRGWPRSRAPVWASHRVG